MKKNSDDEKLCQDPDKIFDKTKGRKSQHKERVKNVWPLCFDYMCQLKQYKNTLLYLFFIKRIKLSTSIILVIFRRESVLENIFFLLIFV